ncbi:hypothetical protein PISMIDRAFT_678662 [Pisolithus microcarpus 441]|uniref:Uncharacterized protein n=1 Tax=Pisolithus microcarpus 441 TaxID=765257 RepID=A0A0C9ZDD7_9AGAM|nr:hypothetical protein PISMIDRAFT_678662 [Pisolithus microcarpus 441]
MHKFRTDSNGLHVRVLCNDPHTRTRARIITERACFADPKFSAGLTCDSNLELSKKV